MPVGISTLHRYADKATQINGQGRGNTASTYNALPHNALPGGGRGMQVWKGGEGGVKTGGLPLKTPMFFLLVPSKQKAVDKLSLLAKGFKCMCSYGCPAKGNKQICSFGALFLWHQRGEKKSWLAVAAWGSSVSVQTLQKPVLYRNLCMHCSCMAQGELDCLVFARSWKRSKSTPAKGLGP